MFVCSDEVEKITHIQTNKYTDTMKEKKQLHCFCVRAALSVRARDDGGHSGIRHPCAMLAMRCDEVKTNKIDNNALLDLLSALWRDRVVCVYIYIYYVV